MFPKIITEIKRFATEVQTLSPRSCYFTYDHQHLLFLTDSHQNMVRICLPHLLNAQNCDSQRLTDAINHTNREVKYAKALVLAQGSLSIYYDHYLQPCQAISELLLHMTQTVCLSARHLMAKLNKLEDFER